MAQIAVSALVNDANAPIEALAGAKLNDEDRASRMGTAILAVGAAG